MARNRKAHPSCPWPWLLSAALATLGQPARADWLVTRDGQVLETEGAWTVDGKLVKFKTTAGTLSSMRSSEVDLEASRDETTKRAAPPPPPPPPPPPAPPKKAVLVLTDRDVKRAVTSREGETERAPAAREIVMYTTDWCPVCKSAREFFNRLGVPFVEKDIEKNASAREEYTRKSGKTNVVVPLIDIEGELFWGLRGAELMDALARRALKTFEAESKAEREAREQQQRTER